MPGDSEGHRRVEHPSCRQEVINGQRRYRQHKIVQSNKAAATPLKTDCPLGVAPLLLLLLPPLPLPPPLPLLLPLLLQSVVSVPTPQY